MQDRDLIAGLVVNALIIAKVAGLGWNCDGDPAYTNKVKTNPKMLAKASYEIVDALFKEAKQ